MYMNNEQTDLQNGSTILAEKDLCGFSEYNNHYLVLKIEDESVGLKGFIAIHRHREGIPALGATRLWNYQNEGDALRDALRLAHLMSYKSALAGLPYTGAKAVLILDQNVVINKEMYFKAYAKKVNELLGKFVTGTDVGVSNEDLDTMRSESRFMIGSGVDSGYFTAVGVMNGIKVTLRNVFGDDDISKRTFAIQGLGKTGWPLLKFLEKEKAKKIYVADISPSRILYAKIRFPGLSIVSTDKIHTQDVDVFCPCALSHAITSEKVPELKCKIIAGSANNQLDKQETGQLLCDNGIIYAPDFIINSGGIISVVDQYENEKHEKIRVIEKIGKISNGLFDIFQASTEQGIATNILAGEIAKKIISTY